ncbi:MAG TPA: diacylglycerol kinase family protein [Candidatus Binatia bacterium]|nr:diacylglycerol kinase family protein [Candidatus Binatia bacterium]
MRVTVIHNPEAGDETRPTRGQLEALIKEAGHKVRYQSVKEGGWSKALKKEADLIAVAGGDGTVAKVARRIIGKKVPVTILPMGTANNISRTLGIASLPVTLLIASWEKGKRLPFDAGMAEGPWGERHFIEGFGTGFFPRAVPHIDSNETIAEIADVEVKVTYTLQLLREYLDKCPVTEVKGTLDGENISGGYLLFEAMLIQFIGPNLHLAPNVRLDDGMFDVVMVHDHDREKLHEHLETWQEGALWPGEFQTRQGAHLKIEWKGSPVHIDDKVWPREGEKPKPAGQIELKIEPKAIEFLVPRDLPEAQLQR